MSSLIAEDQKHLPESEAERLDFDFDNIELNAADLAAMKESAQEVDAHREDQNSNSKFELNDLTDINALSGMSALNGMDALDTPAPEKGTKGASKSQVKVIVAVGVSCIVVLLGVIGFVGSKYLSGSVAQSAGEGRPSLQQQAAAMPTEALQNQDALAAQDPALASIETANAIDSAFNSPEANAVLDAVPVAATVIKTSQQEPVKDLIVTYDPAETTQQSQQPALEIAAPVKSTTETLTDEDKLYDGLLSSVNGMDVPPEAIKIDETVVKRKLESQRLNSMEQELQQARASVAEVKGAVDSIHAQLSGFTQLIEKNSADQAKVSESVAKLAESVAAANVRQERELKEMRAAIAAAEKRAKKAESSASEAKVAAQKSPTRDVVEQVVEKQAPATAARQAAAPAAITPAAAKPIFTAKTIEAVPQPKTVVAPVHAAGPANSLLPTQCDGSRVSAVWKVKGVNSVSAYVVRPQDNQAMYLEAGVEVPGYGRVQAFDPGSRSVCTTSGLIRR
ncbi:hypothetical protein VQ574_21370 (plasmid) [Stutzerimonas frequens]|uniref:hypothetical protein n=1 Tax=Stutzerimonas frequens TaxID=2968969 RepID=UPI002DBBB038|nr:hypothetical protein [Stutzerimonas frequens]WRW29277.1 hypothetical protein VQ574_21370 [Stutzerimonas frequens]